MKKICIALLAIMLCVSLVSCGDPIEKANSYIAKLDENFYEDCSWASEVRRMGSKQNYIVYVTLPIYSDTISSFDSVQNSPYGNEIATGTEILTIEKIFKKMYPKLNSILSGEESIDSIIVFFEFADGYASRYYFENGERMNYYDLFD